MTAELDAAVTDQIEIMHHAVSRPHAARAVTA
jgi:hypothetical protein